MRIRRRRGKVKGKEPASDSVSDRTRMNPNLTGCREVHCYGGEFNRIRNDKGILYIEELYGGAFVLRDEDGQPLLARGFPMSSASEVLAQAIALMEAVKAVAQLGEEKIVFCSSSEALMSRLIRGNPQELDMDVEHNLQLTYFWATWIPKVFFSQITAEDIQGVKSVASAAATSAQHLQWDSARIKEMGWDI